LNQGVLSHSRWAYKNKWLSSQRSWVERMEVFFGVNINIILEKLQLSKFYLQVCAKEHYSRNR